MTKFSELALREMFQHRKSDKNLRLKENNFAPTRLLLGFFSSLL